MALSVNNISNWYTTDSFLSGQFTLNTNKSWTLSHSVDQTVNFSQFLCTEEVMFQTIKRQREIT